MERQELPVQSTSTFFILIFHLSTQYTSLYPFLTVDPLLSSLGFYLKIIKNEG